MPTSEWKAATSSGIEVIGTRRAITAPMPPPSTRPEITRIQEPMPCGGWPASVVTMASAMTMMPNMLPRRLDSGFESPRSAMMNRTPATRYRRAEMLAFMARCSFLLLVHRQHPLGDQEAAEDVDGSEHQRNEAQRASPDRAVVIPGQRDADREQRADDNDRGDGVGHRHQRRMQRRRHRPDHVVADEHRQHENRQPEHEGINGVECSSSHGRSPEIASHSAVMPAKAGIQHVSSGSEHKDRPLDRPA